MIVMGNLIILHSAIRGKPVSTNCNIILGCFGSRGNNIRLQNFTKRSGCMQFYVGEFFHLQNKPATYECVAS